MLCLDPSAYRLWAYPLLKQTTQPDFHFLARLVSKCVTRHLPLRFFRWRIIFSLDDFLDSYAYIRL